MRKLSLAFIAILVLPLSLAAQAGFYPAFQPTRVAEREYNFGLVDWDGGTGLLFQWREGLGNARSQFTADIGLSIDRIAAGGFDDTDTNIDIDIGGMFEISERMQLRLAATLGNGDAVGVSFVWLPRGLR